MNPRMLLLLAAALLQLPAQADAPYGSENPPEINPGEVGCQDRIDWWRQIVDDFKDGDSLTTDPGRWTAISDTSSERPGASRTGSSQVEADYGKSLPGWGILEAKLNKRGTQDSAYHKNAGWANIGASYTLSNSSHPCARWLQWTPAISFRIKAQGIDSATGAATSWNPRVGVFFKVLTNGVRPDEQFMVQIPPRQLVGGRVCVRPADLIQPASVGDPIEPSFDAVVRLSWEVRILDQSDSTIDTASARVAISEIYYHGSEPLPCGLADAGLGGGAYRGYAAARSATLLGGDPWLGDTAVVLGTCSRGSGIQSHAVHQNPFHAAYCAGQLSVSGLDGYNTLEVMAVDGTPVARFALDGAPMAVDLPSGTFLLVARDRAGRSTSRLLAAVR